MAQLWADAPQAQVVKVEKSVDKTSPMARLRAGLQSRVKNVNHMIRRKHGETRNPMIADSAWDEKSL